MARAARLPEMLAPVPFDLALGDDVGLADEARPKATGLHLMTKGRGRHPESGGSLGEGEQHLLLFGLAHQVGLDLAQPALHRLAPALVEPGSSSRWLLSWRSR
jgi:hypothetical protein